MEGKTVEHKEKKQTIDFDVCKRNLLLKLHKELDKSKKGSVDEPIVDLVSSINRMHDFCTTSSCSGRFAVFCANYDESRDQQVSKGGKWLFVEHRCIEPQELLDATLASLPNCKGVTIFKLEPFVLHVQCRSPEKAQEMLALAIAAGFRESGILLGRRTILGIRTTANSLEFPLAEDNHLLVSKEYLDYIVQYGNKKFEDNLRRIRVFFESVEIVIRLYSR
ncbi:tRNA wybutosine-synthesizing protein 3-like protein [Blastocystis sp. subtype 4]|uniref:tRNA wybutosine-synthesizing protein 3-like protein n=1 Tax=Blastocystis sp. subtype 4 TaxID=944170 RepID=UPI0007113AA3|nr:tRNA wybutosine-synthesizing protein 3-like protein [Blastocystis sp. subtype 4]KNB41966.1 tRNA wybutosine-synthesizing protein 3-like protein [Blastocystis sp. subtype 4]|eukprot:XP_014525409.1 tRNA wybutosine-synthesizing protein 3-like protein [Blastocystis sp. subtype 4]